MVLDCTETNVWCLHRNKMVKVFAQDLARIYTVANEIGLLSTQRGDKVSARAMPIFGSYTVSLNLDRLLHQVPCQA